MIVLKKIWKFIKIFLSGSLTEILFYGDKLRGGGKDKQN